MQLGCTGEAEWHPEASSRGDAKQPKRRAGRRSGAHTGGWGGGGVRRLRLALAFGGPLRVKQPFPVYWRVPRPKWHMPWAGKWI
jgi:hypothetical protein